jgi:hypothetical protein
MFLSLIFFPTVATELLAKRVWYGSQARIKHLFFTDTSPGNPAACPSPAARLPQEIVEKIIGHLIYDTLSLLACSLTCHSWYIASVPHLHHTLATYPQPAGLPRKYEWPGPLQNASKLGLLPLVKKLSVGVLPSHRILSTPYKYFTTKRFSRHILSQFSRLTNVQELTIYNLDIPSFLPSIQQYFGHFLPTLRSLSLVSPKGSSRQIVFFIGLFQHLEDLTLLYCTPTRELDNDRSLIPLFTPPLRGRLVIAYSEKEETLGGYGSLVRGDPIPLYGPPRRRNAAAAERLCEHVGNTAVEYLFPR